jgi:hypothetical protein
MILQVPEEFMPKHPIRYPSDNVEDFERWMFRNFRPTKNLGRVYLPVQWTAYYCKNGYGQNPGPLAKLQKYLDGLKKDGKYWTCIQYDDGCLNNLDSLDIRVYSMSGRPMDYALPLVCQPHALPTGNARKFLFSYVGRNTHPIRQELLKLRAVGAYMSTLPHNMKRFVEVLAQSKYVLCPRGYGPTSFRIMEALQAGAIPVYISDKFVIPHAVPFSEYGILVRPDQVSQIPNMLHEPPVPPREAFERWFTYEAVQSLIYQDLLNEKKS